MTETILRLLLAFMCFACMLYAESPWLRLLFAFCAVGWLMMGVFYALRGRVRS